MAGEDYPYNSLITVTIPAGDYSSAVALAVPGLTIVADAIVEADETIEFALQGLSASLYVDDADGDGTVESTHVYTIENDDSLVVEFTQAAYGDAESAGGSLPGIRISGGVLALDTTIDVELVPVDTTASAGLDFAFETPRTITISAGDYTAPATLPIGGLSILDDEIDEAEESIALALARPAPELALGGQTSSLYTIGDDDVAGAHFAQLGNLTGEDGSSATFTAVLGSEPTGAVTLAFASSDTHEGSVPASLSFTTTNWAEPQTITVTGVDDSPPVADGTRSFTVITDVDDGTTVAPEYVALQASDLADLVFQNQDDDGASVMVTVVDGETDESGADVATLVFTLGARPDSAVTIPLEIDPAGLGEGSFAAGASVATSSVTISPDEWATGVAVTLHGVDDRIEHSAHPHHCRR